MITKTFWKQLWTADTGQDLVEYALMLAFVGLASVALFWSPTSAINSVWSTTNSNLTMAAGS